MKMNPVLILTILVTSGCTRLSHSASLGPAASFEEKIARVESRLGEGLYYQARKEAEALARDYPDRVEVINLIETIRIRQERHYGRIDQQPTLESMRQSLKEISRTARPEPSQFPEEMEKKEKNETAALWLERAESLLQMGKLNEAAAAAETVFQYEPGSVAASELLDRIRAEAIRSGRREDAVMNSVYDGEIRERVHDYLQQAEKAFSEGRYGKARFSIQKVLLLEPENRRANRLHEQIMQQLTKV